MVDKPAGMTSHDVVARIRRLARTRRVGHGGTLDPMATGVLVIGVDRATRLLTYVIGSGKSYPATIRLGAGHGHRRRRGRGRGHRDARPGSPRTAVRAALAGLRRRDRPGAERGQRDQGQRGAGVHAGPRRRGRSTCRPAGSPSTGSTCWRSGARGTFVDVDVDGRLLVRHVHPGASPATSGPVLGVGGHLTALRRTAVGGFHPGRGGHPGRAGRAATTRSTCRWRAAAERAFPRRDADAEEARVLSHGGPLAAGGHRGPVRGVRPGRRGARDRVRTRRSGPRRDRAGPAGPGAVELTCSGGGGRGGAGRLGPVGGHDRGLRRRPPWTPADHRARRERGPASSGCRSVVVTFDPHPSEVVRPGSHPAVLTEPARKAELIEELGVDVLCVIPFTLEFSQLSAETFVHDVLVEHLHAAVVVVGENFRFGHRAAGDVAAAGAARAARSGSRSRARRWSPTATAAVSLLDVHPQLRRRRGRGRGGAGRSAGRTGWRASWSAATSAAASSASRPRTCCTAPHAAVPADGVYAAWLRRGRDGARAAGGGVDRHQPDVLRPGAPGRGVRPGLRRRPVRRAARLDFVARLREQRRYDGIEPLVAQIREDVERDPGAPWLAR